MKYGVIGSAGICIPQWLFDDCIPWGATELVIPDELGIISAALVYKDSKADVTLHKVGQDKNEGIFASFLQKISIIEISDEVIFLWDGICNDMKWVHTACRQRDKRLTVRICT